MPKLNASRYAGIPSRPSMSEIIPTVPFLSSARRDARPACEWVMPVAIERRDYARTRKALPPGMPDCLEVSVVHSEEGIERCTAAIYGAHVYLIHYQFESHRRR
jgi:hypothetical protein